MSTNKTVAGCQITRRNFVQAMGVTCLGIAAGQMMLGCSSGNSSASDAKEVVVDVLVMGGGGSGLAAAVTAAEMGKSVAVLEKLSTVGGTFGLSHFETIALDEGTGEFYDADGLFEYWMQQTGGTCNEELMRKVTSQINDSLAWLGSFGVEMYTTANTRPGAPAPIRFQSPSETGTRPGAAGGQATTALAAKLEELGGTIYLETVAKSLIIDDSGAVTGIEAESAGETIRFLASRTILAAGSFESGVGGEGNPVINEYCPKLLGKNMYHVGMGYAGNTGDGIIMGRDAGARVEFHIPYVRGRMMCGNTDAQLSGVSVLVNGGLERVGNEAGLFRELYDAAVENGGNECLFTLVGQNNMPANMDAFEGNECLMSAPTLDELAGLMGVDEGALTAAVDDYNSFTVTGVDEVFQKPAEYLVPIEGEPLYAERIQLLVGGCIGGLTVDGCARVLGEDGNPVANLYAAGDTCNPSFHGSFYLGSGSNTCFALNSGRIAAREAVNSL